MTKKNNCNTCKYPEFADLYNKFTDDLSEAGDDTKPRIELIYDKYICNKGYDELIPVYCIILGLEVECKRMIEYYDLDNKYKRIQEENADLFFYNALEKLILKEIDARISGII